MSLDPPYIPEFAEAGFLAPVPEDVAERVTEDVVQSAIDGSTWNDELVAVPFWANTQLLWYKKSVAEAAGLDPENEPVTWEQLVAAAEDQDTTIAAQGIRAEALTVWLNALIESAGGSIIEETADDPADIQLGLESDAAVAAAEVMNAVSDGRRAGLHARPVRTRTSPTSRRATPAFMVNWPFVWPRALAAVEAGTLDQSVPDDYGWALYPRVDEDEASRAALRRDQPRHRRLQPRTSTPRTRRPSASSPRRTRPTTSSTNGNPAAKASVYDDPEVIEVFPQAPVIRESLENAAPRPQTAYYSEVSGALQREYHPAVLRRPGDRRYQTPTT